MERTFAIIKPDAVKSRYTGRILQRIEEAGFTIRAMQMRSLSTKEAEGFYAVHRERPFFASLTQFMSSGPVTAAVVEGHGAIPGFRALAGATDPTAAAPGTIRGDLGRDWGLKVQQNIVHGSDSPESAAREIGIWFPGLG